MAIDPRISLAAQAPDTNSAIRGGLLNADAYNKIREDKKNAPLRNKLFQDKAATSELQLDKDTQVAELQAIGINAGNALDAFNQNGIEGALATLDSTIAKGATVKNGRGMLDSQEGRDYISAPGRTPEEVKNYLMQAQEGAKRGIEILSGGGSGGNLSALKGVKGDYNFKDSKGNIFTQTQYIDPNTGQTTNKLTDATGRNLQPEGELFAINNLGQTVSDIKKADIEKVTDIEKIKTSEDFIREMNKQTQTPKGRLELANLKAEQVQKDSGKIAEQMEAGNALATISRLQNSNLESIYGRGESIYPELFRSQEGIDRIADRDQTVSLLKLAARQKIKGQGTVSDNEGKMLGDAATILSNPNISAEAAMRELNRVMPLFQRILADSGGESSTGQASDLGDGFTVEFK